VLWERATGKKVRSFAGHTDAIQNVVFAADGRTLFSASRDGTMRFWDMQSGRELRRIAVPHLSYAALNADGRQALSTSSYGTLVLWQIDSIEAIQSWVTANRYIPELTCEQRDFYQVKPLCDEEGQLPSPTPTPPTSATATPSQRQQGGGL
jgi:WD40 repeat protein